MNGVLIGIESKEVREQTLAGIEKNILKAPGLDQLNAEQLQQVAKWVMFSRYATEMSKDIDTLEADYTAQKTAFIDSRRSDSTKTAYRYAFTAFEDYTAVRGLADPLKCTAAIADDWIYSMSKQSTTVATIRRNVTAISSFFTFVDRRTNGTIRNPFAGTKALPQKAAKKQIEQEIPTTNLKLFAKDVQAIIDNESDPTMKAMIVCMAKRGLRVGAFKSMSIRDGQFFTLSKGKRIHGEIPAECVEAIKEAGLKLNAPFKDIRTNTIAVVFKRHTDELYKAGKISYRYSCHDLRHFFALTDYSEHHDIYRISQLLNHASVNVTQVYLRGLKVTA